MEYGTEICNNNYLKYVGYGENAGSFITVKKLFSDEVTNLISKKITELTKGLRQDKKLIVVTKKVICDVLSSIYSNFRPKTGDIYSRYTILDKEEKSQFEQIIDITIEVIYSSLKNEYEIDKCNKNLTIWNSLLGDFNKQGLRPHAPIKIRKKKPQSMFFFENY